MTSLALLQQGQRTQRETNQYNIECESGPSLMQGDRKREKKKEDADTKGEKVELQRKRTEKCWESENRDKRNDQGGKGMERREAHTAGDCKPWVKD